MNENLRCTGRTFRTLLNAIAAASEGKDVIFVGRTTIVAEDACYKMHKIIEQYGIANNSFYQRTRNSIQFPAGSIKCIGSHEKNSPSHIPAKYYFDDLDY